MTEPQHNSLDLTGESFGYWQQKLAGSPPLLELPADKPRTTAIKAIAAVREIALSADLHESLQTLVRERATSLFVTLLAAFKVLLYRCVDRADILVGALTIDRHPQTVAGLDWCIPADK